MPFFFLTLRNLKFSIRSHALNMNFVSKYRLIQIFAAFSAALTLPVSATTWLGYIVVYNNSDSQGSYVFGTPWDVSDLKTTLVISNPGTLIGDELVLQPNSNVYANAQGGTDADRAFWTNSTDGGVTAGPEGNKWPECSNKKWG